MLIYLMMIDTPEDRSKFEHIYTTYYDSMMGISMNILRNPTDAEDAVHQTFLRIAETIETIDVSIPKRLKGLISLMTEQSAIDLYRYHRRHPVLDSDSQKGIVIEYTGLGILSVCLARLPANYRTVLLLKYHYGYNTKEIGRFLGLSESNVYKQLQRAKKKLEEMCKAEEIL